uniref:C1q domain-containing protein n=1 Tax=Magallana gigas TaxID=29159 RepID=A0A8W8JAP9_MAGGI|nr:uncharacterized protein LOC105323082 [Crassostrea gigas]
MKIMKKSLLLFIILFYSVCFAVSTQSDTKDDIRELARRLEMLEHKFVQEQHRGHNPSYPPISHGFINGREGNTIRVLQHRLQILEDKLFQYEKHFDETKHYNNRIQSLENTVQELSNLVKKQSDCTKSTERVKTMIFNQHNTVLELRKKKLQKKKSAIFPLGKNNTKQDENTNGEETSVANDNKTNDARYIRSTDFERYVRKSNFNKKRLLLPIATTTPYPSPAAKIVAFYAYMSATIPSITGQSTLVFDVSKTDDGNGYHPSTGVFIAPETGVYVFTWTMREASNCRHSTQLMVNNAEIGIIHLHSVSGGDFVGTGVVVTHVNTGDDVYVRTHASWNNCHIASDISGRSSFAGWKLS